MNGESKNLGDPQLLNGIEGLEPKEDAPAIKSITLSDMIDWSEESSLNLKRLSDYGNTDFMIMDMQVFPTPQLVLSLKHMSPKWVDVR